MITTTRPRLAPPRKSDQAASLIVALLSMAVMAVSVFDLFLLASGFSGS